MTKKITYEILSHYFYYEVILQAGVRKQLSVSCSQKAPLQEYLGMRMKYLSAWLVLN